MKGEVWHHAGKCSMPATGLNISLIWASLTWNFVWFGAILENKQKKEKIHTRKPQSVHCGNKQPATLLLAAESLMLPCSQSPHQWQPGRGPTDLARAVFFSAIPSWSLPSSAPPCSSCYLLSGSFLSLKGLGNSGDMPHLRTLNRHQTSASRGWSRQELQQPATLLRPCSASSSREIR